MLRFLSKVDRWNGIWRGEGGVWSVKGAGEVVGGVLRFEGI